MGRWLARSTVLLLLVAGLLGGIIWLGEWARRQLNEERFQVAFADIDCDVPEAMERRAFLAEVQYDSRLPERVNVLDDDLCERLAHAFARHPWVEKVDDVHVTPPAQITVRLHFRTPVLAVSWDGELRAVDCNGVLLPKKAPTRGLPFYDGVPQRPRGPAGTHWGDTDLERTARKFAAQK